MKKIQKLIWTILFDYVLLCTGTIPKTKEDCLSQSNSFSRCCYNGETNKCLLLVSNSLDDYYALLKQKGTNNIDCGFNAGDEINYCRNIVPYPTSDISACTGYKMVIPDVGDNGSTRSYRCCMKYDEYFNNHCESNLMGETDYEIKTLKRGAVSGNHYYCKNNNYEDTLLKCAYSTNIGPSSCSKNIINSQDALFYEGFTFDRCCYVAYENHQVCSPFPSDDDYINDFLAQKKKEGYSSYIVKCGGETTDNDDNSDSLDTEVTVNQCESIHPHSIKECTKHTIIKSEIKNIQGYNYDKCCFYEVGNGINSCAVLPGDNKFLNSLKQNSKLSSNSYTKINLVDCKSFFIIKSITNLLIIILLFL